jgi:hypothetical protein
MDPRSHLKISVLSFRAELLHILILILLMASIPRFDPTVTDAQSRYPSYTYYYGAQIADLLCPYRQPLACVDI